MFYEIMITLVIKYYFVKKISIKIVNGYASVKKQVYNCKRIPHQTNHPYCQSYGEHRHTGKGKNIKEEGDPHKTWRQETKDMKSEEVNQKVKLPESSRSHNGS